EERFRSSVENMLDCFAIYRAIRNQQGQIIDFQAEYINDAACHSSQIEREQHLSRGLCELLPGHRDSGLFDEYCQVVTTGEPLIKDSLIYEDEFGHQRLTRAFDIRVAKFGDGYVASWRDMTDRQQAVLALQESEQKLSLFIEYAPVSIAMFDRNMHYVAVSQGWVEMYQLESIAAVLGRSHYEIFPHIPARWRQVHQRGLAGITEKFEEDRFTLADGSEQCLRWEVHPWRVGSGEVGGILILVEDVWERQQVEQERTRLLEQEQSARAAAERANRIKDEFLAVLSHELRSPLNPILGWTKLLQTRNFNPTRTAEALATIERNAKLQTQLIDDLLDVAKILRGKLSIDTVPVDLVFVIESAIDTVRTAAIAKSIWLHPQLTPVGRVAGDAARLQQIVWNLLSNAVKFTPNQGRVDIRLSKVGTQAQITISDTGKGINRDFLPYLFESFRQEDTSITRQYGGLGLGLAIVRSLVEAHGGTITADSPGEGQGASFTVQLPLLDPEAYTQPPDELLAQDLNLSGIRILAVDDEADARELLAVLLTQYGAEVMVVDSAAAVLAQIASFQPDVLISDIGMPEMDGYTLLQQLRALPAAEGGQVPAIALTAYAREEDQQRAIASGFQRQMTKPLEPEQLVQATLALIRSQPA
ncbi:MAG: hybrid sensor histidine kinase/response regulator, partial [Almyronema sp.]